MKPFIVFIAALALAAAGCRANVTTTTLILREELPLRIFVSDLEEFSGILVPTRHRIFGHQPDGKAVPTPLAVSIDLSQVEFS